MLGASALFGWLLAWDEFFYALLFTSNITADAALHHCRIHRRARHRRWTGGGGRYPHLGPAAVYRHLVTKRWSAVSLTVEVKDNYAITAPVLYIAGNYNIDLIMGTLAHWPPPVPR